MTPIRDGIIVAPADGRVSRVANAAPPKELELGERPLPRVSIFMSVFDCHVNRSPVSGQDRAHHLRARRFRQRGSRQGERDNERNSFVIATPHGRIGVVQIAGLIARRIVCFVRPGETWGPASDRDDPFWLARRCLSARRRARAGCSKVRWQSPAKPSSLICEAAIRSAPSGSGKDGRCCSFWDPHPSKRAFGAPQGEGDICSASS